MGNACYRDFEADRRNSDESYVSGGARLNSNMQKKNKDNESSRNDQNQDGQEEFDISEEQDQIQQRNTEEIDLMKVSKVKKVSMEDFKLQKVLGKGSFGKVMLVQHKTTKEIFAMKVLLKKNIKNERHKRHTQTERLILGTANNTFLVKLQYAFQSPHKLYLVVDYMPGGELFYHLRKVHRFSEEIARFYAAEILLGIQYMHENNMIYRDLKPENLLLDSTGHVKLTDFGLSKILGEDENGQAFSLCGTPEYLAPEILTSKTGYDKNCDWWSYGALLYEMLVGAPPFYSDNKKEMIKKILTQPIPYPNHLSVNAKNLLQQLLVQDVQSQNLSKVSKRLGFKNDGMDIRQHQFFETIDFEQVLDQSIKPPYEFDKKELKFFDADLIKMQAKDTPVNGTIAQPYQNFSNFTYQQRDFQVEPNNGQR